jgi:dephospho-CoA kinase
MFISNDEKKYLFDQIKLLTTFSETLNKLETRVIFWEAKVRALEGKVETLYQIASNKPKKPKTLAQKAKQREYMRKYVARKKAEKLALEQK